ncbi:YkgJ family cysteine cluster protein [Bdellovibrio sp. HCB2-146]|uniref:YkgJ family cysteine cluster protein n=1 Tax=Bdellovibrio sp. HCB2-146 TaxID=3394362 RepID=UPI0039BD280E
MLWWLMTKEAFYNTHTKLTRSLKKFVEDYEGQLSREVFEAFLVNLSEELQKASEVFRALSSGEPRARKLHELVEKEIEQASHIEVSCRKGCSACCHMEVEVTSYEADILAKLVQNGHVIDEERLTQQSQRSIQDKSWSAGIKLPESRCVFLNQEGACSIYEDRPVMCRRHSVTSPAKNCESLDAPITLRYFPKVDLLISAANEDSQMEIGPLAKMLALRLK